MANVTRYSVLFHGSPDGFGRMRAQIVLYDGENQLGWVRFHDPDMPFPADGKRGEKISMHMPSTIFENVISLLRNEKPINFYFNVGRAFLGTTSRGCGCPDPKEPVGEGKG